MLRGELHYAVVSASGYTCTLVIESCAKGVTGVGPAIAAEINTARHSKRKGGQKIG